MKLVSGLLPATKGQVRLEGRVIQKPTGNVGMAFQNPTLLPWRNVLENLLLPLEVVRKKDFRSQKSEFIAEARRLLELVSLRDVETKFPWQLSGGMQQRVSLCRALIHRPEILLLDEPFAALDEITRADMRNLLNRLIERRLIGEVTTVLVTHSVGEAVALSDRVLVVSPRPAHVVADISIDLPRPRSDDLDDDRSFVSLCGSVRRALRHGMSAAADRVD